MKKLFQNQVLVAPIAGVTDLAFREICADFGAGCVFTEMVSIRGLHYRDKKTATLLQCGNLDIPTGVQLFGNEPEFFAEVAQASLSYGGSFIDVNMGCPVPKIISNGDGSALMRNPQRIYEIVKALTNAVSVPVSVKIRSGVDSEHINAVEAAKMAEAAGAAFVTVHGRTAEQMYSGKADWNIIQKVAEQIKIPVVGNGDIVCPQDAKRMLEQTGCAAVMLARGVFGNPWLIRDTVAYLKDGTVPAPPSLEERIAVAKRHFSRIATYKGEAVGIPEARKHALWYVKGQRGATAAKNAMVRAKTLEEMFSVLNDVLAFRT